MTAAINTTTAPIIRLKETDGYPVTPSISIIAVARPKIEPAIMFVSSLASFVILH
jgi:hypothetical protein